jgi:hypothetical protein
MTGPRSRRNESAGPPEGMEQPTCNDCGSFKEWVDKTETVRQLPDDQKPPGPWGYWSCPRCSK